MMTDVWVCSACKSLNRQRDTRCYRCGTRQEAALEVAGSPTRVDAAVATRMQRPYRSAWPLAIVASILIVLVAVLGVYVVLRQATTLDIVKTTLLRDAGGLMTPADTPRLTAQVESLASANALRLGLLVLAVLAFGMWLSRTVSNIPALGGGQPRTTPVKALVYPVIPIVNLIKVPGMIQDALYRVDPKAGGFFMVAIAWFGLVGSWFVSLVGSWAIALHGAGELIEPKTPDQLRDTVGGLVDLAWLLDVVVALMVAGGAVVLVLIIFRIEGRAAARDREIRTALSGL